MGQRRSFLLLLLVITAALNAKAFKEHEFKKCKDAGFCRRNRGNLGPRFDVIAESVAVHGAVLTASLRNQAAGKNLLLQLKAYSDGFVRLIVDEAPEVGRYKITDIAAPELEQRSLNWKVVKKDENEATLAAGAAQVVLSFSPFKCSVLVDAKPFVVINSRGLFNFEHRRGKEEGVDCDGCWDESFLSFTDSKPNGPEALSLDIAFPGAQHVYGIPERATEFSLQTTVDSEPYRLYNLDVFEYLDSSPFGLYGSIPLMLAHKVGLTTGVLWLNAAEMFVDVTKGGDGTSTQWVAESGIVDLFVFVGPAPSDVMRQYAVVTGTTAMPQMFAIGYHQCRWNYNDEADVRAVDSGFEQHEIPYDVIWLDIEHTNGKRYFTWDSYKFPNPIALQNDISSRGRKMVTIVDPHVKRDPSYYIFSEAQSAGHFVKTASGGEFEGWCWPGSSSYPDVTSPEVRNWWSQQFTLDKYQGSTKDLYIWNDMNEPSVFNGPEVTMQKDVLHWGNVEHRNIHNLFGLYYHMATAAALEVRGQREFGADGDRPFVLSRAFFSGTQSVGPIWTGDNTADWKHLAVSVPMLLTLGVTGLPFSGADVGGFFGAPDSELLTRWYQMGIYYPFFRGHAHLDSPRREPWLFGQETTLRIRTAIRERYALLPYMYTLFRHANLTGQPIMRPLWFEFPDSEDTFAVDQEFLLGPSLLVRPVLESGATSVQTALPSGSRWYCAHSGIEVAGTTQAMQVNIESIPVFYRGGGIVPRRERPRRSTTSQARDPFTLLVALDSSNAAQGDLYLDDGRSYAFKRGQYVHRDFTLKDYKLTSSAHPTEPGATPASPTWTGTSGLVVERIVFLGLPASAKGYSAQLPGSDAPVPLEMGPVSQRWPSANAWVLRCPNLPIGEDWQVELLPNV